MDPSHPSQADRAELALRVVREVEQQESTLPATHEPGELLVRDRAVRRPELAQELQSMLPVPLQGDWTDTSGGVRRTKAAVAADVVVLAKFDLYDQVKLRAAYGAVRRALAMQPVRANGTCGITNAVRAHEVVSRHAPGLMPTMTAHGELASGLRYLVEDLVEGAPLLNSRRMAEHLPAILEGLGRVHDGYGVCSVRVSQIWPHALADHWQSVREAGLVRPAVGQWVTDLLLDDRHVRVSWSHGDLVASNVLGTDDGVVLVDWEHSGERPLMHDAAKLHLFAADKHALLDQLLAEWAGHVSAGGYTPAEELALVHARFLSRAPVRLAELSGHRREPIYARQVERQASRLADLHARATA